uniref:Uncharacterized protein n=1 Tax=Spumella elongata TaxID=89044 RepID=A0A7S3H495_9STRA|mmetsp:Transcript_34453/g.59301  ORF Transcript_34453/g.59301 Transcript_34453/m.59301 type:complete len:777 (+) Transcript_34453:1153-3483(+)
MHAYDSSDDECEEDDENDEMVLSVGEEPSGPKLYRRSGEKGEAPATINGRNSALVHFNDFLSTKKLPNFDQLSADQLCIESLWQEYGTYLSEFAKKKNKDDDFLSDGTALNALSYPKELARIKYPGHNVWQTQKTWVARIRIDIRNVVLRRCIELGIQTSKKSKPIGRDALLELNGVMLKISGAAEQRASITFRLAINMTFQAVGRGGECAYSSYKKSHWDSVYRAWCMTWYCQKTNAVKNMSFFCDAHRFEIDIFHSLCCYWILGADSSHVKHTDVDRDWIFPSLKSADNKGVATKISKHLKRMAALTQSVPRDVTAKSLRVGSVGEMLTSTGDVVVGTVRGGWGGQLAGVATILEYHMESDYTLSIGGKALAGWSDPKKPVFPPSCDAITATMSTEQVAHFHNFLRYLFNAVHFDIVNSPLHPLAFCMWASFVQYLPQFIALCGRDHVVMVTLETANRKFGYTLTQLRQWGELVNTDWKLRNVLNVEKATDLGPVVTKLQEEVINLQKHVKLLERTSAEQHQQSTQQLNRIEMLLTQFALPSSAQTSGAKRFRSAEVADATDTVATITTSALAVEVPAAQGSPLSPLMLVPPSPVYQFTTSHTLYDFYCVWYERGFDKVNIPARWECDDRRWKHKLEKAIDYTAIVLHKHEELKANMQQAPNVTSAEYSAWKQGFNAACVSLVAPVVKSVFDELNMAFRETPTISSLYNKFKLPRAGASTGTTGTGKAGASTAGESTAGARNTAKKTAKKVTVNKVVANKGGSSKAIATKPVFK